MYISLAQREVGGGGVGLNQYCTAPSTERTGALHVNYHDDREFRILLIIT
jgi:hypothetical protein